MSIVCPFFPNRWMRDVISSMNQCIRRIDYLEKRMKMEMESMWSSPSSYTCLFVGHASVD